MSYMLHVLTQVRRRSYGSNWFNYFGCDWMIDEDFNAKFLECNNFPGVENLPHKRFQQEMYTVVLQLALRRHNEKGTVPPSSDYEVLFDEATGHAFKPTPRPAHCRSHLRQP